MKAIYLKAPKNIIIKEVQYPQRKQKEVLIKVKSVGICGSDVGAYKGINPLVTYPRVIGHEIAGELLEIPEGENDLKIGDRVIIEPYKYCGKCYPCSIGRTNCCENLEVLGVHIDGGFTEYFSYDRKLVHKIPENISWEQSPMIEPLVIALHSLNRIKLKEDEHIVITGAGPIGNLIAQASLYKGAIPILIDFIQERLNLATKLGINYICNLNKDNPIDIIKTITKGRMAEAVVEASGSSKAIRNSIDYVSYAGRVVFVGWPKEEILMPTALFTKKELDIRGSRTGGPEFPEAIKLIAESKIKVKPLITEIVTMLELPEALIQQSEYPDKFMKINAII